MCIWVFPYNSFYFNVCTFNIFHKRILGERVYRKILALFHLWSGWFLTSDHIVYIFDPFKVSVPFLVHFDNLYFPRQLSISFIKVDGICLCINLYASAVVSFFISGIVCAFSHVDQIYQSILLISSKSWVLFYSSMLLFFSLISAFIFIISFYFITAYVLIIFQASFCIRSCFSLSCFQVNPSKTKNFLFLL